MFLKSTWMVVGAFALTFYNVEAQFPPNGDISVFNKMKVANVLEKATKIREAKRSEGLVDRAVHFMKAAEKAAEIAEFIERGSTQFPGAADGEAGDPIPGNENVGEQIIDPRTPTGFGDPFFRQINVEQKVELDSVMTKHEMTEVRNITGTLQSNMNLGWVSVGARGMLARSLKIRRPEFMSLLWVSPNRIIRRQCSSCEGKFKDVYYKRMTEEGLERKIIVMMIGGEDKYGFHESDCGDYENCPVKNKCNVDFKLYSSYKDAVDEVNPWEHCATVDYGSGNDMYSSSVNIGFPGLSYPDLDDEYDEVQYNQGRETQQDYAFYVEESNWIPIVGNGLLDIGGTKATKDYEQYTIDNTADDLLHASQNMIIRRVCPSCDGVFKDIYYRRISFPSKSLDLWDLLLRNFELKPGNIMGRDFKMYSSYEDAVYNQNEWEACETSDVEIGFPGLCHPHLDDEVTTYEGQWSRMRESDITTIESGGGQRDFAFYIEAEEAQIDIGEWMTEDDEMMKFLNPESTLAANETITCEASSFSHGGDVPGNFVTDLKPYQLVGHEDNYAGWYDLQGCGRCNDWCGWFSSDGYFDGGMDPHYQSWTNNNDLFACITGDSTLQYSFTWSGVDDTSVVAPFSPPEIPAKFNPLVSYIRFIPYNAQKCEERNDASPPPRPYQYVGCYKDTGDRALPVYLGGGVTLENCYTSCKERGYHYFGRQSSLQCFCGGTTSDDFSYKMHGESNPLATTSSSGIETNVEEMDIKRSGWETCYSAKEKNVQVKYYAVSLSTLPSSGLDATYSSYKTDRMDTVNVANTNGKFATSGRSSYVAALFTGSIEFSSTGTYTLCITSDDGSKLFLDDTLFVDNDGLHGSHRICSSAAFEAGTIKHVKIEFFESGGGAEMIFTWQTPGSSSPVVVPASAWVQDSHGDLLDYCTGQSQSIMFGCRKKGSETWDLIGYGSREKAFTPRGDSQVTVDGDIQWYFDSERSFGFAPAGSTIELFPADVYDLEDPHRISWNFVGTDGWRCGDEAWIENNYEKAIWTKDGGGTIVQESYTQGTCNNCETSSGNIGSWVNCVYQIIYDDQTTTGTCSDVDGLSYSNVFSENSTPYKFQSPPRKDPFGGYYDIQRCGKCNDFCSWVGPEGDGSRVNPEYKAYTDTDYFACKLSGGEAEDSLTEKGHFGASFRYQKCTGEGFETPPYKKEKFIGCFHDVPGNRALPEAVGEGLPTLTLHECAESCRTGGWHYFGRQYMGECWCGGNYQADITYDKHGEIDVLSSDYCGPCDGDEIGGNKNCVFQILDQFDPEIERKKHECSHIKFVDVRRYCYVACRDQDEDFKNLLACKNNKVQGLIYLNMEIAAWMDSPKCGRKTCKKKRHPLGEDVERSAGTF